MWHITYDDLLHGHRDAPGRGLESHEVTISSAITLVGRVLFSAIFLVSGAGHLLRHRDMVEYAMANGVPAPELLVPLTGLMIVVGGAFILLGYHAWVGGWLLFLFLVPTALLMHRFWGVTDSSLANAQMAHFMKNIALAGAALLITRFGGGPWSLTKD